MTYVEFIDSIKAELSGGDQVHIEVTNSAIQKFIVEAFDKVKSWYLEPNIIQTVQVVASGTQQKYVLYSSLAKIPHCIEKMWDTSTAGRIATTADISGLLSLEGHIVLSDGSLQYAYYKSFARQFELLSDSVLRWQQLADRVLISGALTSNNVTIVYAPEVDTAEQVTVQKAIQWIRDFALARTKQALGRIRGKFRSSDLNLETDYSDLLQEGNESIISLTEKLQELDF